MCSIITILIHMSGNVYGGSVVATPVQPPLSGTKIITIEGLPSGYYQIKLINSTGIAVESQVILVK